MSILQDFRNERKARLARMQPKWRPPVPNALMAQALLIIDAVERPKIEPVAPIERHMSIRLIQAAAESYFGISHHELCSARRTEAIVYARQVAMFVCKTETARSKPEIGRRFGGRDHSTVYHALNKIEANFSRYEADVNAVRELARASVVQRSVPPSSTAIQSAQSRVPEIHHSEGRTAFASADRA